MNLLLTIVRKLFYERIECVFYRNTSAQGEGKSFSAIEIYETYEDIPAEIRQKVLRSRFINVMYYRLKSGNARLLCYRKDEKALQGQGWIQTWKPFRRKFGAIAADGMMLGPLGTAPEHRGKGIMGKIMLNSLYISPKDKPVFVYTTPDNISSQRGIQKAGFELMGQWNITIWFRLFVFTEKPDRPEIAP